MKTLCTLLFSILSFATLAQSSKYSRVKIFTGSEGLQQLAELGVAVDHGESKPETFFISDFSLEEIQIMQSNNFNYEILIDDVQKFYVEQNNKPKSLEKNTGCSGSTNTFTPIVPSNFNLGSMGGFYTYAEFLAEVDQMASLYPTLITARAPISTFLSHENRPIYWLRISDNATTDEAEPEVMYTSIHHAREPASLSVNIFYMWYLLENYATNPEIQYLVNNTELYFIPMINPDGYIRNETTNPSGGGMWRKNRRNIGGGVYGVDLNRNYSYGWNTTGVSATADGDTWPGTSAFSEPETQAVKWFLENRDIVYAFNDHTYSDAILFPIGTTDAEFAVDHTYFDLFTAHMVELNGYQNMKSSGLYPASGDSDDYMYKVDLVMKPRIFAMTPEIGGSSDGFWPASADITGICQEMVFTNKILAHLPHKYLKVADTDPNTILTTTGNFNHEATRLGMEDGPLTVSIVPLLNIQSVGVPIIYTLNLEQVQAGAFSYVLDPAITLGSTIKYILLTDNGLWTRRDTITKNYGNPTIQFTDPASTLANWTGNWFTTNATFVSSPTCITESPAGNYSNNSYDSTTLIQTFDLTGATNPKVTFYTKFEIENNYDYTQFQVSTDNGATWNGQCGNYTNTAVSGGVQPVGTPIYDGFQSTWVQEEISLSQYIGSTVKFRFVFRSDGGAREDGFFFDDFQVYYTAPIDNSSLDEITLINSHPNPANDKVTISTSKSINAGTISILDLNGKIVKSEKVTSNTNQVQFNVSDLPQGVYHVQLSDAGFYAKTARLVVIH